MAIVTRTLPSPLSQLRAVGTTDQRLVAAEHSAPWHTASRILAASNTKSPFPCQSQFRIWSSLSGSGHINEQVLQGVKAAVCQEVNRRPGVSLVGTFPLIAFIVCVTNILWLWVLYILCLWNAHGLPLPHCAGLPEGALLWQFAACSFSRTASGELEREIELSCVCASVCTHVCNAFCSSWLLRTASQLTASLIRWTPLITSPSLQYR